MSVRRAQDERLEGTPDGNTAITGIMDVPDAPTIGTATAGAEQADVTFTAAATGGTATSFTATSSPGSISITGASSPITVTGLTAGVSYTFTVTAANSNGTSASTSASNSVTPTAAGSFEFIQSTTVGAGGTSTITFSSIPQTYQILQLRGIAKAYSGTGPQDVVLRFNSDSGSNYANRAIYTDGGSISSIQNSAQTYISISNGASRGDTSLYFSGWSFDILNYTSTNQAKTARGLVAFQTQGNVSNNINYQGPFGETGHWNSTAAITTITLTLSGSVNFDQYSMVSLYGIKGS